MSKHRKRPPKRWRPVRRRADIDALVDRFVAAVDAGCPSEADPIIADTDGDTPSAYIGEPDEYGWHAWEIKPYAPIDWVDAVEARLPRPFPAVYRSLITRCIFPAFEAGDIRFFANTPEGTAYYELRTRVFDRNLFPTLARSGYLQIGNPAGVNYDPIGFDLSRSGRSDGPLVQIWHEDILQHDTVTIEREIAPSFQHLMQAIIEAADLEAPSSQ